MINFSQLFTCPNTQLYEVIDKEKKYIATETLSVLIDSQGDLLLMMGPVCYGITTETMARYNLYQNNNGKFMILELENKLHGNYELVIKENANAQLLIACLGDKCNVVPGEKQINKMERITPKPQLKEQKQQELQIGLPSNQNDNNYVKISKSLGRGMFMIGQFISKGITTVGGFVAQRVEKSEEIKFSQSTKQNLRKVNSFSGDVFKFASGSVKKLINYGRQVALDSVNQNDGVKKVEEQKLVNDLKNGAVTGVKVFINLYDGFVEGSDEVKNGAFKAGGDILKKKYGVQAQQALRNVAGGVDNVVKIYKLPKASVKYLFTVDKQRKNI